MKKDKENFFCLKCNKYQDVVGITQKETKYYKFFIDAEQWEDFHGSGDILEQEYFCIYCNYRLGFSATWKLGNSQV